MLDAGRASRAVPCPLLKLESFLYKPDASPSKNHSGGSSRNEKPKTLVWKQLHIPTTGQARPGGSVLIRWISFSTHHASACLGKEVHADPHGTNNGNELVVKHISVWEDE
jgi:hypothetical protein